MISSARLVAFAAASLIFATASTASAASLLAKDSKNLYRVDTVTGVITLIGATPFGSGEIKLSFGDLASDGFIYAVSNSFSQSQVYKIDPVTAATSVVYVIQGPATSSLTGGAIDPTDGTLYYVNMEGPPGPPPHAYLYRVDFVAGTDQKIGKIGSGAFFSGLAFDASGNLFSMHKDTETLWSINKASPSTGAAAVGTGLGGGLDFSTGACFNRDQASGVVYGWENKNRRMFTVDLTTGSATVLPAAFTPGSIFLSCVIGATCDGGKILPYGVGCAGAGGLVPSLTVSADSHCPTAGNNLTVAIDNGLGGAISMLVIGLNQAAIPVGFGCFLNVSPVLNPQLFLPLGGSGPGNGSVSLSGPLPVSTSGVVFTTQAFVFDAASPIGGAGTNGVEVTIK